MGQFITKNSTIKKFYKIKALQAHGKSRQIFFKQILKSYLDPKRVSLRLPVKGSISIEAAIVIPIFLFCFLEVISVINYLTAYSGVLYSLKSIGDSVSVYGNALHKINEENEEINIGEKVISSVAFSEIYVDAQIRKQCEGTVCASIIKNGLKGIDTLGSNIDRENEEIFLTAKYTVKPLIQLVNTELSMSNQYYAKLWTGYPLEEKKEDFVYITEQGTVYHLTEECTHLKLSIKSVEFLELTSKRNEHGEIYRRCSLCVKDESEVNTYFITNEGNRFHQQISCSGLKRTIYRVKKEEVADMRICSRCGGISS